MSTLEAVLRLVAFIGSFIGLGVVIFTDNWILLSLIWNMVTLCLWAVLYLQDTYGD